MSIELEAVEKICQVLNKEINDKGQIQRSNKTIWAILHNTDNRIWQSLLKGADELTPINHPNSNRIETKIVELTAAIKKLGNLYPNVLTPYPAEYKREGRSKDHLYQGSVWHLLMMLREVYCDINGIDLPNSDNSKGALDDNDL